MSGFNEILGLKSLIKIFRSKKEVFLGLKTVFRSIKSKRCFLGKKGQRIWGGRKIFGGSKKKVVKRNSGSCGQKRSKK